MRISGRAMEYALERTQQVRDLGAGKVDVAQVPAARLTGLARYGLISKAPTLKRLEVTRQTATLLATVRHLETATVDDALDLLDALMASKLLAKAERLGKGPPGTTERKVPARSDRCGQYRCSGRSTRRDRCLALVPPGISRMNMSAVIKLVTCRNSR